MWSGQEVLEGRGRECGVGKRYLRVGGEGVWSGQEVLEGRGRECGVGKRYLRVGGGSVEWARGT